ncbi:unnamed protein product [Moneuplotes crassus]|uniref:Uncharacterized protein n=1 Tax=Euplotes crassus TaxID=5936 RepID=A0AAD1U8L9_EUPCR|nr:unnamed protein product [Moneuplotes crassus]
MRSKTTVRNLVNKIADQEGLFSHDTEEMDLKPLIRKWRGTFMKDEIKNYALNHLYVTDPTMNKKDLQRNLKILNDNIDVMGTTDGFQKIEKQIGLDDKILQKSSTVSALKPMKDLDPFLEKKETYEQKKQKLDEERDRQLAQVEDLMKKRREKMTKLRQKQELQKLEQEEEEEKTNHEQKVKELEEKIQNIEAERKRKIEEMNANTKKIEKPHFRKIQKNYTDKVLMPNLEQKKKKLAMIRDMHKPIDMDEIFEHKKKMDEIAEKHRKEFEMNRPKDDFTYKKYETNWLKNVKEYEYQNKEETEKKEGDKKELYEKMRSYGDMVKEMHWPTVSKKKQLEMQLLKQSLNHPIKNRLNGSTLSSNAGNRRSTENLLSHGGFQSDREDEHSNTVKRRKIIWKENPMVPKPKPKKTAQVVDWLLERRKARDEQDRDGPTYKKDIVNDWKKDIEKANLNQKEKYEQLEEEARRKEEMAVLGQGGAMDDNDKLLIFESIKAKLSLMEEFNS